MFKTTTMMMITTSRCNIRYSSRLLLGSVVRFQSTVSNGTIVANKSNRLFPKLEEVKLEELISEENKFGNGTYFVERSETGNIPVYSDLKGGGNKTVTEIRKVRGDIIKLRNDLQEILHYIPKENWKVLPQSHKIIIKGDAVKIVKDILETSF